MEEWAKIGTGCIIENCKNYGTIIAVQEGIGGIVGWSRKGRIVNCENNASINNKTNRIGGIVGAMAQGNIQNCKNNNNIEGLVLIAGICGDAGQANADGTFYDAEIENCKNLGAIKAEYEVGGIAGRLRRKGVIKNSVNTGSITSTKYNSSDNSNIGGIVGVAGAGNWILYCYNTGKVDSQTRVIGGIVGELGVNDEIQTNVQFCYNVGDVANNGTQNTGKTGGIAGNKSGTSNNFSIVACYYLKNCIKKGIDNIKVGGEEKEESEIKSLNWFYYAKDKDNINGGYPILSWEINNE